MTGTFNIGTARRPATRSSVRIFLDLQVDGKTGVGFYVSGTGLSGSGKRHALHADD